VEKSTGGFSLSAVMPLPRKENANAGILAQGILIFPTESKIPNAAPPQLACDHRRQLHRTGSAIDFQPHLQDIRCRPQLGREVFNFGNGIIPHSKTGKTSGGFEVILHLLKITDADLRDDVIRREHIHASVSRLDYRLALGGEA